MYNYLIGQNVNDLPSTIDGKLVSIELSKDNQIQNYDAELVVRVKEEDSKIILTTQYFKLNE